MSVRAWRCQCGKAFRSYRELSRHGNSGSCAVVVVHDRRRGQRSTVGEVRKPSKARMTIAHTLPADWRGDLDQPSLDLPGLVPLIVPGRAS